MKAFAWFLVVLGSIAAGAAILMAVLELGHIYSEAVNDPMGNNSPEPQARARTMLIYAALGLPGLFVSLVGSLLLLKARLKRSRGPIATRSLISAERARTGPVRR